MLDPDEYFEKHLNLSYHQDLTMSPLIPSTGLEKKATSLKMVLLLKKKKSSFNCEKKNQTLIALT